MDVQETLDRMRELAGDVTQSGTEDCVRRKKVRVTRGRHENAEGRSVITVQEPFGDEFDVPYVPALMFTAPGDSVWIEWVYGFGNACAVNSGAWQKSDLPTCVVPTEDGLVIQVNYKDVMVISGNGVNINTDTLSVSGVIEGDVVNTQSGVSVIVDARIQDAIDNLGKHLLGDAAITVPAGTYIEDLEIHGFSGNGRLSIAFAAGCTLNGNIHIRGCKSVRLSGVSGSAVLGMDGDDCVTVDATTYCEIDGLTIHGCERTGSAMQQHGVIVKNGSWAKITNSQIDRFDSAVYIQNAHADVINCRGGTNSTSAASVANLTNGIVIDENGGSLAMKGTIPMGPDAAGTGYTDNGYCAAKGGGVDPVPTASEGSAPVVTDVTTTWTAAGGYYTYGTNANSFATYCVGWKGGDPRTGILSVDYSNRYTAGLWMLDDAESIATTLQGATIKKATVTIRRVSGVNYAVNVQLLGHDISNMQLFTNMCDPFGHGTTLDHYDGTGASKSMANGETATFVLPSSAYAKLQNGTFKGFVVSSGSNPTDMFFDAAKCDLSVTYEPA